MGSADSATNTPPTPNTSPESIGSTAEESSAATNDGKKKKGGSTKTLLSNAKKSLLGSSEKEAALTPMQKLGKTDAALSVPQGALNNSAGESHPTANSSFEVGVTEDRNKKCRRTMEDTHSYLYNFLGTPAPLLPSDVSMSTMSSATTKVAATEPVETDNGYFAVFDGHAGSFAADWCGKKLHVLLEELLKSNPNTPVPEILDQTFTSADQQLEKLPLKNSGCTAIMAVLRWEDRVPNSQSATGSTTIATAAASVVKKSEPDSADTPTQADQGKPSLEKAVQTVHRIQDAATRQRVLYTANVGDARIVLCRNGKALRLSYDHKGSDENEGRRISNAGGLILNNRVNGVLAVTRALGDCYLKDLVTGHPYTTETVIQPDGDEFLILACDGLWDVCSDQEAVDLIRNIMSPQAASKILVDHALSKFSTDNLSVMIVRFDSKKLHANATLNIGVEKEDRKVEGPSEAEVIVSQARRVSDVVDESEVEEVKTQVMQQIEEENHEPGPEVDTELKGIFVEKPKTKDSSH